MNINDVVIRAGVVRFAAPPAAVSRPAAKPAEAAASRPQPETTPAPRAVPAPTAPTHQTAPPADAPEVAEFTAAAVARTRAATEEALASLEAQRAANTKAGVRLRIDESTKRVVTEVLNNQREVIRQLPPEELLRIAERLENVVGLLFDRRV